MPRLLLLLFCCGIASAQTFDFEKGREPILPLAGFWHFHTGDDPRWAAADFDDSNWKLLRSDRRWGTQGYAGYFGFAWYRLRVQDLPPGMPISLLLPPIRGSYQVFANGILLAAFGAMPPHGYLYSAIDEVLQLPSPSHRGEEAIAIRVWHSPGWGSSRGGGPSNGDAFIGKTSLIQAQHESSQDVTLLSLNADIILGTLEALGAVAALVFFLLRRSEGEYLWFAIMLLTQAGGYGSELFITRYPANYQSFLWFLYSNITLGSFAQIFFYKQLLSARRTWLYWAAIVTALGPVLLRFLQVGGVVSIAAESAIGGICSVPMIVWIISLLVTGWRMGAPEARLALVPILMQQIYGIFWSATPLLPSWTVPDRYVYLTRSPFDLSFNDCLEAVSMLTLLAILVGRFARTRREEARLATEFEAARTVQKVLIPEQMPFVPGFQIATIYKPAQEVGGDFFQVIPVEGGALIAIGDVSGKGLQAAMTVSLIVGALRTLATHQQQPAELLEVLNRVLLGRGHGFTTCLIARISNDGSVLIGNAGHLPPYQDGKELAITSDLPLGISDNVDYRESALHLSPESRLTFLSDGVVEARNGRKELFGFERLHALSTQSAEAISKAAIDFGQQDDITVLTIERAPVPAYA